MNVTVKLIPLVHFDGLTMPRYETAQSAGVDLRAALDPAEPMDLPPGERGLIPTGLIMEMPPGYEAQIRPRSGLAIQNGITTLNSPGTIDADFRGEVQIILINHGSQTFTIERGMRIAQMVIAPVTQVTFQQATDPNRTDRGSGGFGSTGLR